MKIVLLLIVSMFFRFYYLGVVPVSLSHDETDNIIQAHSLIQTGSDLEGIWQPFGLLPNSGVMAELSPYINAPILAIFPNNLFTARLTTALLSSIFPLLVMVWLITLGVERRVALVSAALLAISPWHLLFSRTVLEQPTSLFFYLLSWIMLSKWLQPSKSIRTKLKYFLLFTLTYAIGFFTYHGYKFALPVLTGVIVIWHSYFRVQNNWKITLLPLIIIGALLIRTFIYSASYDSRSSELIIFNTEQFESEVDSDRRLSLAPEILKKIYSNKLVKLSQSVRDKYVRALNPDMLFLHGESNGVFSTWQTGYLYLITLPFLLIGIGHLILNYDKYHILILALLILSPLASVMHVNNSVAFRSGIYFVLLHIVIAYGLVVSYQEFGRLLPKLRFFATSIFLALITISFSYFCYIYFFVTPVTNANAYFFGDRLVANYVRLTPGKKIMLIVSQPRYLYSAVQLTHSNITHADIESFGGKYSPTNLDEYFFPNLVIARGCPKNDSREYDTIIVSKILLSDLGKCDGLDKLLERNLDLQPTSFVSPQDSGEEYRIFGDTLCGGEELSTYVHPESLSDFKLETMGARDFCQKWVVRQ